jgi:SAM-dependent methyltransferase
MVGPPGVWKESQAFQLDFLRTMGLTPEHTVLDIGCGPLRGGIVLIEYLDPEKYVGFDVRPEVVAEAERQIAERGLAARRPTVFVSAGFGRDELGDRSFDVIWVFQVVYHLDDLLVEELFAEIARRLAPTGAAYANVNTRFPPGRYGTLATASKSGSTSATRAYRSADPRPIHHWGQVLVLRLPSRGLSVLVSNAGGSCPYGWNRSAVACGTYVRCFLQLPGTIAPTFRTANGLNPASLRRYRLRSRCAA